MKQVARFTYATLLIAALFFARPLFAQESLVLSVTPPLFQLNTNPGQTWQSYIKVINGNTYPLTVYASVNNFAPKGEDGQGVFIPLSEAGDGNMTLGQWIAVMHDAIVIPPEQSVDVPVSIAVPKDAPPGGHFAAILIGTKPPEGTTGSVVKTSQLVTSLFFLRVAGDVHEKGQIREFSVTDSFHSDPYADFLLRFENQGNVQLQPKGGITIYNMWGKERGYIPINQNSNFGNVLPESIRRFELSWKGEQSLTDIGRYTAIATLTYGQDSHQNTSNTLYFWVVPLRATLITLGVVGVSLWLLFFLIRRYIRRAIYLAGYEPTQTVREMPPGRKTASPRTLRLESRALSAPLREGVLDLRRTITRDEPERGMISRLWDFVLRYKYFFGGAVVVMCIIGFSSVYFLDVLKADKTFEVTVNKGGTQETMTSEEVLKERMDMKREANPQLPKEGAQAQSYDLTLINATTKAGAGAAVATRLEEQGYTVTHIEQDTERLQANSAIVYDPALQDVAFRLSQQLGNVLLSTKESDPNATTTISQRPEVRVIIGNDLASQ